eukprot:TRINITY_DN9958_c0_g1_i4.p1 TRINITY_DN9958_c0_g1~~TRINITY_DN9958_c0_g1_i4.p1  ORF type:complete len:3881 (+),score=1049.38 TRINITY_DN9958_c0_g1_i4:67-11709(+)
MRVRPLARAALLSLLVVPQLADAQTLLYLEPEQMGLGGGLQLTIIGQGFSGDPFIGANRVLVGGIECTIDDAFTREHRIVCPRAPPSGNDVFASTPLGTTHSWNSRSRQVEVQVDGRWVLRNSLQLQYNKDKTPWLQGITHASVEGRKISFRGVLISRDPAEYRVLIGDVRCSVIDELHDAEIKDVAHEPGQDRRWACQAKEQEAGYYSATVAIEPDLMVNDQDSPSKEIGAALPSQRYLPDLFKMTSTGMPYMVAHYAVVSSYTPNEGSPTGGSVITLLGSGFSTSDGGSVVLVGGVPCEMLSADETELRCRVPSRAQVAARRSIPLATASTCTCEQADCCSAGGAGVLLEEWKPVGGAPAGIGFQQHPKLGQVALGNPDAVMTPEIFATDRGARACDLSREWLDDLTYWDVMERGTHFIYNSERFNGDAEVPEATQLRNVGRKYSSYFVPPYTAPYTFYASGNDFVELWIEQGGTMVKIASATMSLPAREARYYVPAGVTAQPVSDPIQMTKGVPVYMEVVHGDHTGENFFHIGVSHPIPNTPAPPVTDSPTSATTSSPTTASAGTGAPTEAPPAASGAYSTVPTMLTVLTAARHTAEDFTVNGRRIVVGGSNLCDAPLAAEMEDKLGNGAHVISSGVREGGGCRYWVHIFRPQGELVVEGDVVTVVLAGSLDWYYEPIPLAFLRMPVRRQGAVPIDVLINDLPATSGDTGGLTWLYLDAYSVGLGGGLISPTVVGAGTVLRIDVTPATFLFDPVEATVTIAGQPCMNDGSSGRDPLRIAVVGSNKFLDCDVPALTAGTHEVIINLGRYGTATNKPANGWSVSYKVTVTGFRVRKVGGVAEVGAVPKIESTLEGSLFGGAAVTIIGDGFSPVMSDNTVAFGSAACTVISASIQEIVCVVPEASAQGAQQVYVNVKGASTAGPLTYTYANSLTPQITSVSVPGGDKVPSAGGAAVTILGSGFPDQSRLEVVFCLQGLASNCSICNTNTSAADRIECTSPLLSAGAYQVRVRDTLAGWSNSGATLTTDFVVTQVRPIQASTQGGAIMTITGSGFTDENFVMIGPVSEVGLVCKHRSRTNVQIVCQIERNTRQLRGPLTLRVYANQEQSYQDLLHAHCVARPQERVADALQDAPQEADSMPGFPAEYPDDVCFVDFQTAVTPEVTGGRKGNGHNSTLEVKGKGLQNTIEVRAGGAECDPATIVAQEDSVTCSMGSGPAGTYRLEVTSTEGFAKLPASQQQWWDLNVQVDSVSPAAGSYGGGQIVTIGGYGFHPDATTVAIGGAECRVQGEVTGSRVVCLTGRVVRAVTADIVVTAGGIEGKGSGMFEYSQDLTAEVRSVSPSELTASDVASATITVGGRRFPAAANVTVGGRECVVSNYDASANELICTVANLPAMLIAPVLHYPQGLSVFNNAGRLSVPLAWQISGDRPVTGGELGGRLVKVTGTGLTERAAELDVKACGVPCLVQRADVGSFDCVMPRLITRDAVNRFQTGVAAPLTMIANDSRSSTNKEIALMFDGSSDTEGSLGKLLGLQLVMPAGKLADIRHIWFFPSDSAGFERYRLVGALFQSRGLGESTWTTFHNVTKTPVTGWTKIDVTTIAGVNPLTFQFRVIPNQDDSKARLAFKEVRLLGHVVSSDAVATGVGLTQCPLSVTVTAAPEWPAPSSEGITVKDSVGPIRYEADLTPIIRAFVPEYGTAAGGTRVTILGQGLDGGGTDPVNVSVDGVNCTNVASRACTAQEALSVPDATCTAVECTTGERPLLPDESKIGVVLRVPNRGYAYLAVDPYMYADKWSSSLTWRGQQLPADGDTVLLPKGRNIILDRSPLPRGQKLFFMLIDGALIFSDEWEQDADPSDYEIRLDLTYILIRGGTLRMGSKEKPFQRPVSITLYGDKRKTIPLPVYGTKNIAVRGGKVQLFGQPKLPTWTRLAETALAGRRYVKLREITNWKIGDEIIIAPGGYNHLEAEQRNVTKVDRVGGIETLWFDEPLRYSHFGTTEKHGDHIIDMSIEVGVLSRNIKIQGDPDSWKQKFGAHMIFHSPDRPLVAQLEYVELRRCGQAKQVGRYPIHFHIEKDRMQDVYVKGCSVHNSFNRAIVLHDTSHVRIEWNVAFNAFGHMFFVEDGSERYNTLYKNLGIQAKPTGGQLSHDVFTSVFWGANPQNNFIENAAAGSSHMGFWFSPPKHPRQSSFDPNVCPSQVPMGEIRDNTAHSNGRHGFWVHPDHFAREIECGPGSEFDNPFAVSYIKGLRTWKNREQGLGLVDTGPYEVDNVISIDCDDAGVEVGHIVGEKIAVVRNSVFVARSLTNTFDDWSQHRGITGHRGLITPQSEGFYGENLTFIGFKDSIRNKRGLATREYAVYTCCRCWNDCSSEMGAFTYRFKDTKWVDCENRVHFGWPHKDIIIDEDGTFTGTATVPGEPMSTLVPAMVHLKFPECKVGAERHWAQGFKAYTGNRDIESMVCPPEYAFHRAVVYLPKPTNQFFYHYSFASPYGVTEMLYDESVIARSFTNGWASPVATAADPAKRVPYRIFFSQWLDWRELHIWITEHTWNPFKSTLQIDFNYTNNYVMFDVVHRRFGGFSYRSLLGADSPVQVLLMRFQNSSLQPTPPVVGGGLTGPIFEPFENTSTSNLDTDRKTLSLLFHNNTPLVSHPQRSQMVQMLPIQCPRVNGSDLCIHMLPEYKPPKVFEWTDPEAWDEGVVPSEGDSVVIRKGRTILLRGESAKLTQLTIQGVLILLDNDDIYPTPAPPTPAPPTNGTVNGTAPDREAHPQQTTVVKVEATYIFIQSGTLQIGTPEQPFDNDREAHVILHGGYGVPGLSVDNDHWLGAAVLANFGEVQVHGRPARAWTRLAETSAAGSRELRVQNSVGAADGYKPWRAGDQVWVPSTNYDPDNGEVRTIQSVSADGLTITLTEPLQWEHLGQADGDLQLRGEVGLLSRNVKFTAPQDVVDRGVSEGTYGIHIMFGELSNDPQFAGRGNLSHCEVRSTGQFAGDRGGILLDRLTRARVELSHLSVWQNQVYAVKAFELTGTAFINLHDSVLYRSRQPTVQYTRIKGQGVITSVLAGGTEMEGPGQPGETSCTYYVDTAIPFKHNVAAGAWQNGFCIVGDRCSNEDADSAERLVVRNWAHSNSHGFWVLRNGWCTELRGMRSFRNSYLGVWAMLGSQFRLRDSFIHDNYIGVDMIGTGGRRNAWLEITDTIIAGRTPSQNSKGCGAFRCQSWHYDVWRGRPGYCGEREDVPRRFDNGASTGILLSQMRANAKPTDIKRALKLPLPYDKLGKTTLWGVARLTRVTFRNFKDNGCGTGGDAAVRSMDESRSHIVPHFFSEIRWENVDDAAKYYLNDPSPSWRTGVQCGDGWDCSGLHQTLLQATDGSLFGTGGTESLVSTLDGVAVQSRCTRMDKWNAMLCSGVKYGELFVQSLDWDSQERRIYPLRVHKTNDPIGAVDASPSRSEYFLVNQPPDKYKQTEWPSFKRPSWFWSVVETNKTYRIDFGDLPPKRTYWHLEHCTAKEKVVLNIFYPEPLRIQVWLDPNDNETGRTPTRPTPVTLVDDHSANHYIEGVPRLMQVVMECGKGFEIHQLMLVRVAMRLDLTIEEFYDETTTEQFGRNIAMMLGIPQSRIRIVDVQAGSVVLNVEIDAVDSQNYDTLVQKTELDNMADRLGNLTAQELTNSLGVPVAAIDSIARPSAGTCRPTAELGNETVQATVGGVDASQAHLCNDIIALRTSDDGMPVWAWVLIALGAVLVVGGVAVALVLHFQKKGKVQPKSPESIPQVSDKQPAEPPPDGPGDADEFPDYSPPPAATAAVPSSGAVSGPARLPRKSEDGPRLRTLRINLDGDGGDPDEASGDPAQGVHLVPPPASGDASPASANSGKPIRENDLSLTSPESLR